MDQLIKQINSLSRQDKDTIYRMLWFDYVKEDIMSRAKERGIAFDEDVINAAADSYVYDGCYDCNLTYWENIDSLINAQTRRF